MRVYIIQRVENLTDRYHGEGGLAIVANDDEHAKVLFEEYANGVRKDGWYDFTPVVTDTEWQSAKVYELAQDAEPEVFIFPDAGCC